MSRQLVRSVILAAAAVLGAAKTAKAGPLKPSWSTTVGVETSSDVSTSETYVLTSVSNSRRILTSSDSVLFTSAAPTNTKTLTTTITTSTAPIATRDIDTEGAICGRKGYLLDSDSDYVGSGRNGSVPECLEDCLEKDGCRFVVFEEDRSFAFYSEVAPIVYQNTTSEWYELVCDDTATAIETTSVEDITTTTRTGDFTTTLLCIDNKLIVLCLRLYELCDFWSEHGS